MGSEGFAAVAAALLVGPLVAFSYAVVVWITYACSKECSWLDTKWIVSLSLRLSLFVLAVACLLGVDGVVSAAACVPAIVILNGLAAAAIHQTRVRDVVGCLSPVRTVAKFTRGGNGERKGGGTENPSCAGNTVPFSWLKNKTVLVTGANTGIGKETVTQLALLGADTIVLACRTRSKAWAAISDIRDVLKRAQSDSGSPPSPNTPTKLLFLPLDLGNFASVRKAVDLLESDLRITKLDVLICNAGVMMGTKTISEDGYELMMQANHLGHFLLTKLLVPKLQAVASDPKKLEGEAARVITLTSSTYALAAERPGGFDFDDMFCESTRTYSLFGQYAMTKLANILFAKEMDRRYGVHRASIHTTATGENATTTAKNVRPILSFAVHPGIVRTDVTRNMPLFMRVGNAVFAAIVGSVQKTPSQGAYSSVSCASANPNDLPESGSYICNCRAVPVLSNAESQEDSKRLWEVSERLVRVR